MNDLPNKPFKLTAFASVTGLAKPVPRQSRPQLNARVLDEEVVMKRLLIVTLIVISAALANADPQIYAMPSLTGVVPPSINCPFTFPLEMSDVDSISVRFVGYFTEGIGLLFDDPKPREMPHRPSAMAYINDHLWTAYVPSTQESGPMDVVVRVNTSEDIDLSELSGAVTEIWVEIIWSTAWQPLQTPSATIDNVELWIWNSESSPVESSSWSSVKELFRNSD